MMTSFNSAFAAARKAGKKTFTWSGKSYNTKLAKDNGTPTKAPVPKSRPVKLPDTAPVPRGRPAKHPNAGRDFLTNRKEGNWEAPKDASKPMPKRSPVTFLSDTKKETPKTKSKEPLLGKRVKYKRASWL